MGQGWGLQGSQLTCSTALLLSLLELWQEEKGTCVQSLRSGGHAQCPLCPLPTPLRGCSSPRLTSASPGRARHARRSGSSVHASGQRCCRGAPWGHPPPCLGTQAAPSAPCAPNTPQQCSWLLPVPPRPTVTAGLRHPVEATGLVELPDPLLLTCKGEVAQGHTWAHLPLRAVPGCPPCPHCT